MITDGDSERGIVIQPDDPRSALTVRVDPRQVTMRLVTEGELAQYIDQYESSLSTSLSPMFFNIVVSALITLGLAWIASPPTGMSAALFAGAAVALTILTLYFGIQTRRERAVSQRERERLRRLLLNEAATRTGLIP